MGVLLIFMFVCFFIAYLTGKSLEKDKKMYMFAGWSANNYYINYNLNDSSNGNGSTDAKIITSGYTNYITFDADRDKLMSDGQLRYYQVVAERLGYKFMGWARVNISSSNDPEIAAQEAEAQLHRRCAHPL